MHGRHGLDSGIAIQKMKDDLLSRKRIHSCDIKRELIMIWLYSYMRDGTCYIARPHHAAPYMSPQVIDLLDSHPEEL